MIEPIKNTDGTKKQDCETNAAKRFITGDDLFSRQPMIETVYEHNFEYIFVAKQSSHTFMMSWIENHTPLNEIQTTDEKGRTVIYQWMNNVPLIKNDQTFKVNFF